MASARAILTRVFNSVLTLIFALVLISFIFAMYKVTELEGRLAEELPLMLQALEQQYRGNPELFEEKAKQLEQELRAKYGLTGTYWENVINWTIRLLISNLMFDFGTTQYSYIGGTNDVGEILLIAMKNTIILFGTATVITSIIGIIIGLQMARRPGSLLDRAVSILGMISWSLPTWWVAIIMLLIFSFYLDLFPTQAMYVYSELANLPKDVDLLTYAYLYIKTWLKYMTLPVLTLVLVSFGGWAYIVRNIVLSVLQEDFVMAARARGLPERRVIYGHVLRTSSPPIVTYVALSLVGALGGAIITEAVFGWPGMGLIYWVAIQQQDATVLVASTWVLTVFFIVTILILDFIYALLDPRVRVG